MKLPEERILQFIERERGISIDRNHFASREYYNANHPQGKDCPVFYANNGDFDGRQTAIVEINSINYVVDRCGEPFEHPIPILRKNPRRE